MSFWGIFWPAVLDIVIFLLLILVVWAADISWMDKKDKGKGFGRLALCFILMTLGGWLTFWLTDRIIFAINGGRLRPWCGVYWTLVPIFAISLIYYEYHRRYYIEDDRTISEKRMLKIELVCAISALALVGWEVYELVMWF